jgi:translocator protein
VTFDIAFAAVWGVAVAGLGAFLTELSPWYYTLKKPSWQPPDWLFGPAWTVILGLASLSLFLALRQSASVDIRREVYLLFILNGIFNIMWSPLFFRARRPDWALAEVPLLWLSILVPIIRLMPISVWASVLLVPYLAWVSFATILNATIVRLNRPFATQRA